MVYNKSMTKSKKWDLEKIKEGFEKFQQLNNRYPAAYDVDDCDFLPSSRQIQRAFGGLVNLRKTLNLSVENYTKGAEGTRKAIKINMEGKRCELYVFELLKTRFDERFIHIEKPLDHAYKNRYDFYIYSKPNNFAIDVFSTDDARCLVNIMNIKAKKYAKIKNNNEILYFVCFDNGLDWNKVQNWLSNKKELFPENWKVLSIASFKDELNKYNTFKVI